MVWKGNGFGISRHCAIPRGLRSVLLYTLSFRFYTLSLSEERARERCHARPLQNVKQLASSALNSAQMRVAPRELMNQRRQAGGRQSGYSAAPCTMSRTLRYRNGTQNSGVSLLPRSSKKPTSTKRLASSAVDFSSRSQTLDKVSRV